MTGDAGGGRPKGKGDPPACVIGLELTGLGVARSLARGGVEVLGLETEQHRPSARTRHARTRAIRAFGGEELIEDLLALAEGLPDRPVLFATKEATVATLSQARERLAPHYRFLLPPPSVVRALTDKIGFQQAAEVQRAPLPRAVMLADLQDLEQVRRLTFPCVMKPDRHVAAYEARFSKAYKVADGATVERLYAEIRPVHPRMIVQEWIEGEDGDIYFCLQYRAADGTCRASFTGRKIRSWPPETGGTASCTAAPEAAPVLEPLTSAFFAATGCVGLMGMEFKRDRRSGRYLMVEPTVGRTDHQEEVATLNGVNLPLAAYRDLVGGSPPPAAVPRAPRIWRDPVADANAIAVRGHGAMPEGDVVDAYWRLDDPLPWLAFQALKLRRRLGRKRS
jgi:D-aspartate ligase